MSAPLTCAECQELIGAYALGALDDDEAKRVRAHLSEGAATAEHRACLEELAAAKVVAGRLTEELLPVRPAASLWSRIEAEVRATRSAATATTQSSSGPWRLVALALAVAVIVLLVLGLSGRTRLQTSETEVALAATRLHDSERRVAQVSVVVHDCTEDLSRLKMQLKLQRDAVALVDHPGTKVIALASKQADSPSATAIVNVGEKRGLVLLDHINVPTARDYELWVIRGSQKKAAGLLRPTSDGALVVELDPKLLADGVDALAVTLEPAGGGPAPRGPIVLVAAMPKT